MSTSPFAKVLRAARAASGYGRGYEWEAGWMLERKCWKTGCITSPDNRDSLVDDGTGDEWEGDFRDWSYVLANVKAGDCIDFYVSSTGPSGELETNIGVHIVSETEAIWCDFWCDCGGEPHTVKLPA